MKLQLLADGCRLPHPLPLPASSTRMVVLARPAWLNGIMQVQHINDVSVFWCSRGMQGAEECTGSLRDFVNLTHRSLTDQVLHLRYSDSRFWPDIRCFFKLLLLSGVGR